MTAAVTSLQGSQHHPSSGQHTRHPVVLRLLFFFFFQILFVDLGKNVKTIFAQIHFGGDSEQSNSDD